MSSDAPKQGSQELDLSPVLARIRKEMGVYVDCDPGWHRIVLDLEKALSGLIPSFEIHQVKQKFGTLRFYWSAPDDVPEDVLLLANALVTAAETASASTCENCSAPGGLHSRGGWVKTLCVDCAFKEKADPRQAI